MPLEELLEWTVYWKLKDEAQEKARKRASSGGRGRPHRGGRRP